MQLNTFFNAQIVSWTNIIRLETPPQHMKLFFNVVENVVFYFTHFNGLFSFETFLFVNTLSPH